MIHQRYKPNCEGLYPHFAYTRLGEFLLPGWSTKPAISSLIAYRTRGFMKGGLPTGELCDKLDRAGVQLLSPISSHANHARHVERHPVGSYIPHRSDNPRCSTPMQTWQGPEWNPERGDSFANAPKMQCLWNISERWRHLKA